MIYADTSFIVASKVRRDNFFQAALVFLLARPDEVWLWSPWHRIEVFNSIRQLTCHPETKRRLREPEARALIHRIETDVRIGYFTHMEADWRDVLRTAGELSVAHGFQLAARAADLLHLAYAKELAASMFVSFDLNQLALAKAAGIKAINPAD
jgi:predicted nucleic acid-binding protein